MGQWMLLGDNNHDDAVGLAVLVGVSGNSGGDGRDGATLSGRSSDPTEV